MATILDSVLSAIGLQVVPRGSRRPKRLPSVRTYHAGGIDRLTYDWVPSTQTADMAIGTGLETMRARSRQLEKDNRYVKRFLSSLENNVLGADGINLQMKIRFSSGRFDTGANSKIEDAWEEWGQAENCSLNQEDDWIEIQKLMLRSAARDGGILIRLVRGRQAGPFGLALEPIEIDLLDTTYSEVLANGNEIRLGVERNPRQRVVAYHLRQRHPGDSTIGLYPIAGYNRIRVPAYGLNPSGDEILHYFVKDRVLQSVGVPWITAAMSKLHHLDQYEEAELLQSRQAAQKGGWFENERGEEFTGDTEQITDPAGNTEETHHLMDFDKAAYEELPAGVKFIPYDPTHPNPPYEAYVRTVLHGIAAGLNTDYATLTGDLSQNSFSSTKAGRLESQEEYKKVQGHFISNSVRLIFTAWLEMAMLSGRVNLPMSKFDHFNRPKFRGRRWPWVDPVKEIDASAKALEAKIRTRTEIIAENGGDFEDVVDQLKLEKELMQEAGLLDAIARPPEAQQPQAPNPRPDDEEDPDADEQPKKNLDSPI